MAILLCLTSCALDEDLTAEADSNNPYDFSGPKETYYAAISLEMPESMPTRAYGPSEENPYPDPDFVDGIGLESKISNVVLIFYNKDGQYVTHLETDELVSSSLNQNDEDEDEEEGEDAGDDGEENDDGEAGGEDDKEDEGSGDGDSEEDLFEDCFEPLKWSTVYAFPIEIYNSIKPEEITSFFCYR